jgi:hypothetical protein
MREEFGRRLRHRLILTVAMMLLAAVVCYASPITYSVNRTVGTGTVTGFIETDGTLNVLNPGNIVDWSLALVVGPDNYTLTGPLSGNNSSVYGQGVDTTATPTQLLFNFSGTDNGYLLFQYGVGIHDGFHYYCVANFGGICLLGETDAPAYYTAGQTTTPSGDVVIGTAGTVPEPGTLLLLGSGIVGLAGIVRRKVF